MTPMTDQDVKRMLYKRYRESLSHLTFEKPVYDDRMCREALGRSAEDVNRLRDAVFAEMHLVEHPDRPGWMAHPRDLNPNPEQEECVMKSDDEKIEHSEKLKGWMAVVAFLAFHRAAWFLGPFWFAICMGVSACILVAGLDGAVKEIKELFKSRRIRLPRSQRHGFFI